MSETTYFNCMTDVTYAKIMLPFYIANSRMFSQQLTKFVYDITISYPISNICHFFILFTITNNFYSETYFRTSKIFANKNFKNFTKRP